MHGLFGISANGRCVLHSTELSGLAMHDGSLGRARQLLACLKAMHHGGGCAWLTQHMVNGYAYPTCEMQGRIHRAGALSCVGPTSELCGSNLSSQLAPPPCAGPQVRIPDNLLRDTPHHAHQGRHICCHRRSRMVRGGAQRARHPVP